MYALRLPNARARSLPLAGFVHAVLGFSATKKLARLQLNGVAFVDEGSAAGVLPLDALVRKILVRA